MERSVPIRSVSRSIAVLQAINRGEWLTVMEISKAVGLPYPTTFRIIQTLMHEGLVVCEASCKRYRVTALVQSLALGYADRGSLIEQARPRMVSLTQTHAWPVSLTTRVGRSMIVRDSTHTLSSLTFCNYSPGYSLPLLECASGHAFLANVGTEERLSLLAGLEEYERRTPLLEMLKSERLVQNIRDKGYATWERNPHSQFPGKTSAIAVPVFEAGTVAASLTLVFFASAMPMAEAVQRYAGDLMSAACEITEALADRSPGVDWHVNDRTVAAMTA
ncbi:helix-turn-helix domain-containing protein [Roseateles sp. SL47]|uniref:IclR family transcriptional regulator domain-containing protein n=1 Tax=Roseateles sp. SL47 TaxID=2995138 RepID=UPI002271697D|nr:helix-turn-helix domain-containing protein [Roseateles sp. SL47]WAC71968.1 helix-turn-helix domain-containing protein [Roseateles sp. SL47]